MPSQTQLDETYMGTAILHAKMSKARRSQVGACLVTENGVCLTGYNGTPPGRDNNCEIENIQYHKIFMFRDQIIGSIPVKRTLTTKPDVLHAELNCIMKAAREGISVKNSTVYVTLSPCVPCAAMMVSAGIKRLVYKEKYRDTSGIEYLKQAGIKTEEYNASN